MTTFIEYKAGKVYDPAHLRPFDLALAKAGHPLAGYFGSEVTHVFAEDDGTFGIREWRERNQDWVIHHTRDLRFMLRLAPLAIKDGRALHVGDLIEIDMMAHFGKWAKKIATIPEFKYGTYSTGYWRFADEVSK